MVSGKMLLLFWTKCRRGASSLGKAGSWKQTGVHVGLTTCEKADGQKQSESRDSSRGVKGDQGEDLHCLSPHYQRQLRYELSASHHESKCTMITQTHGTARRTCWLHITSMTRKHGSHVTLHTEVWSLHGPCMVRYVSN